MKNEIMFNRRAVLKSTLGLGASVGLSSLLPNWAQSAMLGNVGLSTLTGTKFDLNIGEFPVVIDGRNGHAVGINGTLPGPLIRFREGENITINVTNNLREDTSIHWHGLLVPFHMDGVPGVSFPGIKPGETFSYRYSVPQSGTYWYHSHSGLQEQIGHYGPLIVDPRETDPVKYDREYVLVLSDWSFENPHRIFSKLKSMSDTYNFQKRTVGDFVRDAKESGFANARQERANWGRMRMAQSDIADVTGSTYTYLINGHSTQDNWTAIFNRGERVRLRIINASAMSLFNVRIPGLPMQVVAADGLNVRPVETDEFQIGTAETYDVIVEPKLDQAYAIVAESIDRSGQAVATLAPRTGLQATPPALRRAPTLTMKDMGMSGHEAMGGMAGMAEEAPASTMDHAAMGHGEMGNEATSASEITHDHPQGFGVATLAETPVSRLDEPGLGLEDVPHRTLRYSQLRSLKPNPDTRKPSREIDLHLTSNMERYMWSFDGVKYSEVTEAIKFYEGERVRLTMTNDTMMSHPMHLHGMYFELENGGGKHRPRKHTVILKPGERLSVDISAEHIGDWAFHCHLLYHMEAGMFRVVSVIPKGDSEHKPPMEHDKHDHSMMHSSEVAR